MKEQESLIKKISSVINNHFLYDEESENILDGLSETATKLKEQIKQKDERITELEAELRAYKTKELISMKFGNKQIYIEDFCNYIHVGVIGKSSNLVSINPNQVCVNHYQVNKLFEKK